MTGLGPDGKGSGVFFRRGYPRNYGLPNVELELMPPPDGRRQWLAARYRKLRTP
jgi:hypothetical protein